MNTLKQGHGCKKFIEKGSISHFGSEEYYQRDRKQGKTKKKLSPIFSFLLFLLWPFLFSDFRG